MMEMKITVEAPDLAASILKLAEAIASGPDPSILTPDEPLPVASYPTAPAPAPAPAPAAPVSPAPVTPMAASTSPATNATIGRSWCARSVKRLSTGGNQTATVPPPSGRPRRPRSLPRWGKWPCKLRRPCGLSKRIQRPPRPCIWV